MSRPRAFTIIEVLVAGVLMVLLLGLAIAILLPAIRYTARGQARATLQEQGVLACNRLIQDLQTCLPAGVGIRSTAAEATVSNQALADFTSEARRVYSDKLVVYSWTKSDGLLKRRIWPPGPPALALTLSSTQATRPSPAQLLQLSQQPSDTAQVLAQNVDRLQVTHAGAGAIVESPLRIELVLEVKDASGRVETFELRRTLSLRQAE